MSKFWFGILFIFAVVGCTSDNEPDFVVPTQGLFEVLTATPFPTSTPAPTPTPTAVPTPTPQPPPAIPFPLHIDPDQVSVRPSSSEIVAGWTSFLSNARWDFEALDGSTATGHLCADGSLYWDDILDGRGQDWQVIVNPAIASDEWSHVIVEVRVGEFQSLNLLSLERKEGQVWNGDAPIVFRRSQQCISLAAG